jgi:hypothetical protein
MSAALPGCDLKSFKGTAQEIAKARQIVASHSKAKKRSVEECVRQYVIKNPQNCNMDDADREADMIMNFTMLTERNKKIEENCDVAWRQHHSEQESRVTLLEPVPNGQGDGARIIYARVREQRFNECGR